MTVLIVVCCDYVIATYQCRIAVHVEQMHSLIQESEERRVQIASDLR